MWVRCSDMGTGHEDEVKDAGLPALPHHPAQTQNADINRRYITCIACLNAKLCLAFGDHPIQYN